MKGNKNRVIVVGLDGATFTLLDPLMDEGKMPNLKKIIENGVSGNLRSTTPPFTAPAWSSFATGKNPGKHGAFDFVVRDKNNEMVIINSKVVKGRKIWNILNKHNKKAGVIHFPISYPPEKINGFMISGFISPVNAENLSFPQKLYSEILNDVGDYVFYVRVPERKKLNEFRLGEIKFFIDELIRSEELRYKAFNYLSKRRKWDFLFVLFMSLDKVQHVLWKYLNREDQYNNKEIYEYSIKCFQQIDAILGDLLEKIDENTSLIFLSDHGFTSKKKCFYINRWLEENGFLTKSIKKMVAAKIKETIGFKSGKFFEGLRVPTIIRSKSQFLNMQKTIAYSATSSSHGIWINLKNRDENGIVREGFEYNEIRNRIRNKLLDLKDKETGVKIFDDVSLSEQIYNGPFVKYAPDLILSPAEGYFLIDALNPLNSKTLTNNYTPEGTHYIDGIFIALDRKIFKEGVKIDGKSIIDVAPTILYSMRLPIPSDMDGKVITSIFKESFLESNPLVFSDTETEDSGITDEDYVYSEEDEEQIRDSLKGLGYLD